MSRVGQVWELTWRGGGVLAEVVLVVSSEVSRHGRVMNRCLVLDSPSGNPQAWPVGRLVFIGDWQDDNGWKRIA